MKTLNTMWQAARLSLVAAVVLVGCGLSYGQTILTTTTLSAALTSSSTRTFNVASATNITAPSTTNNQLATYLYVDRELMSVEAVSGTLVTAQRGAGGTTAATHASSALVFVIPAYLSTNFSVSPPQGSCTRASVIALPVINPAAGVISDCVGGQWVNGDALQTTRAVQWRMQMPPTAAQNAGAVFGNNTTSVLDSLYCTEIDMSYSKLVTGLGIHVGTTGNSSDLWVLGLYDSAGNLIANSATAGTAPGSAYAWSNFAFTSKYYVVGPGQYYGCMIPISATTATVDTLKTAYGANYLTYTATSSNAYLPTSFTVPTGFNNAAGPFLYVY